MSPAERVGLPHLCSVARAVLAHRPAGLVTDFDGTLSPIVPDPSRARIDPGAREALATLASQLDLVAVVSGRRADEVRTLVGLERLTYVGNHGLEVWEPGGARVLAAAAPYVDLVRQAVQEIGSRLALPGILIEPKGATASLHYRQAAQPAAARAAILKAIEASPSARRLRVSEGRLVVNLLPPIECHKGTAVRSLVERYALRGVIFMGDDTTDVDAFAALRELRQQGLTTLAIAVASPESPAPLLELADYVIAGTADVAALLRLLSQRDAAVDPPTLEEPR